MTTVVLIKISQTKVSKYGGTYKRCFFVDEKNNSIFLDVYDNHFSSKRWIPYLKEQNVFKVGNIINNKFIDGKSDFIFTHNKKTKQNG